MQYFITNAEIYNKVLFCYNFSPVSCSLDDSNISHYFEGALHIYIYRYMCVCVRVCVGVCVCVLFAGWEVRMVKNCDRV